MGGLANLLQGLAAEKIISQAGLFAQRPTHETTAHAVVSVAAASGTLLMLGAFYIWAHNQYGLQTALWMGGIALDAIALSAALLIAAIRHHKRQKLVHAYNSIARAVKETASTSGVEALAAEHPVPSVLLALAAGYMTAEKIS